LGSHHKKKKKTPSVNVVIADIKRDADQEASKAALQPSYEGNTYIVQSRTMIDFVNVTESTDPSQTGGGGPPDTIPPAAVTGLSAIAISSSQINLSWTANTEPDLNHYNVYRGTSSGFVVTLGVTVPVGTPSTNSYSDTGRTASTTYYYRVSAVDASGNIGPLSSEANATTFGGAFVPPMLELRFENNYNDTSSNAYQTYWLANPSTNGFAAGQFGQGVNINTPVTPATGYKDGFLLLDADDPLLRMNTSVGFSFSCWIYPVDLTHAVGFRRFIIEKADDASNYWSVSIDNSGVLYFFVTKAGTTYKRQVGGFALNSFQHIGAVFNGATNTVEVYRNGVAGTASTAAEASTPTPANMYIGASWANAPSTYYEGILDELRYYQAVLTSTQINNLKNTNAP
jgi:concanavalin A-like lectin/glucanase superfamily protein/fibronectin type III domain protein